MGDRVAVLKFGQLQQFSSPTALYDRPANAFVARFIGSPSMNFIPGQLSAGGVDTAVGTIPLPDRTRSNLQNTNASRDVVVGIRPEHAHLTDHGGLAATIRRVEDVGRHRILRAELAGRPFDVILPEGAPLPPGPARLAFAPGRVGVYADDWRVAPLSGERAA